MPEPSAVAPEPNEGWSERAIPPAPSPGEQSLDVTRQPAQLPTLSVTVWRQDPGGEPRAETHQVPFARTSTVLDLLEWLKDGVSPGLAFRSSCRSGVCGSCGVMANGRPVLACETPAAGFRASGLALAPLARLPVLRDLITDVDGFLDRLRASLAWLVAASSSKEIPNAQLGAGQGENINRQTPAQLAAYRALTECVNCLLCYAACPVFPPQHPLLPGTPADPPTAQVPEFLGPAALALARRWDLDSRDQGSEMRFAATAEVEEGIWACVQDGSCTAACPKGVDPKRAIGDLQRAALG